MQVNLRSASSLSLRSSEIAGTPVFVRLRALKPSSKIRGSHRVWAIGSVVTLYRGERASEPDESELHHWLHETYHAASAALERRSWPYYRESQDEALRIAKSDPCLSETLRDYTENRWPTQDEFLVRLAVISKSDPQWFEELSPSPELRATIAEIARKKVGRLIWSITQYILAIMGAVSLLHGAADDNTLSGWGDGSG